MHLNLFVWCMLNKEIRFITVLSMTLHLSTEQLTASYAFPVKLMSLKNRNHPNTTTYS